MPLDIPGTGTISPKTTITVTYDPRVIGHPMDIQVKGMKDLSLLVAMSQATLQYFTGMLMINLGFYRAATEPPPPPPPGQPGDGRE